MTTTESQQRERIPIRVHDTADEVARALAREIAALTREDAWQRDCHIWLYRSPARDWDIAEIDMAVPMSPLELTAKLQSIRHHKSQRDQQTGESWRMAEHRDQAVARAYDEFGLANYEAIEPFRRYQIA